MRTDGRASLYFSSWDIQQVANKYILPSDIDGTMYVQVSDYLQKPSSSQWDLSIIRYLVIII